MSIRSFFKQPSPTAAVGEDDGVPAAKRARLSAETPEAVSAGAVADALASPTAGDRPQHETPDKDKTATQNVTSLTPSSNATQNTTSLTPEQLERIAKNKALAIERKRELEAKNGTEISTVPTTVMEAALAIPARWKEELKGEFGKAYFTKLVAFHTAQTNAKKMIFPPVAQVFSAFYACDFDKVSVVIVGQDPYHGGRQAHGLAFSVQKGVQIPPSLRNMYKELSEDTAIQPKFKAPNHGCLTKWAQQGVLLINACMSVESGKANSHQGQGWETFTDAVIAACNKRHSNLIFLLWGAPAAKKCSSVDMNRHTVLKAPHPSPLSAHRGFFGCKHFSQCNDKLKALGRPTIDWQIE